MKIAGKIAGLAVVRHHHAPTTHYPLVACHKPHDHYGTSTPPIDRDRLRPCTSDAIEIVNREIKMHPDRWTVPEEGES